MLFGVLVIVVIVIQSISNCHSDDRREEESRGHKVGVTEILRFALDDKKEKTQWNSVLLCGEKNTRMDDKGKGSFGL